MRVLQQTLLPVILTLLTAIPAMAAKGWDREKAFAYLEQGQRDWAAWPHAKRQGGPCVSCHTGLSYSFARLAAGEKAPRPLEQDILAGIRTRLATSKPLSAMTDEGAEAVLNLVQLSFARTSAFDPLPEPDNTALKLLRQQQIRDGARKGSWTWFSFALEPWDSETSNFFGATLAARALAAYPPQASEGAGDLLRDFLNREGPKQPLHNRLGWIAFGASGVPKEAKALVLSDLWAAQSKADGGWTSASMGPWTTPRGEGAPADEGSNAYATAWAAFTAREAGVPCTDRRLQRALLWLASRQDQSTGAWHSVSMNKTYPAGSIQSRFMSHAATGYATAALCLCGVN